MTFVVSFAGSALVISTRRRPSFSSRLSPAWAEAKISACGRQTREASPGVLSVSKMKVPPALIKASLLAKVPMRILGPCKSARMPMGRFNFASTARMLV